MNERLPEFRQAICDYSEHMGDMPVSSQVWDYVDGERFKDFTSAMPLT